MKWRRKEIINILIEYIRDLGIEDHIVQEQAFSDYILAFLEELKGIERVKGKIFNRDSLSILIKKIDADEKRLEDLYENVLYPIKENRKNLGKLKAIYKIKENIDYLLKYLDNNIDNEVYE
jgi:hypothetical protein